MIIPHINDMLSKAVYKNGAHGEEVYKFGTGVNLSFIPMYHQNHSHMVNN